MTEETDSDMSDEKRILAQFKSENGDVTGNAFDLPLNITAEKLQLICNAMLTNEDPIPYSFFVNDVEVSDTLVKALDNKALEDREQVLDIVYLPQAIFRVRAVTRCTSTIPGHAEAVISVAFSPDGRYLASGSGDTTVRFWDVQTETPHHTCKGHKHWVLCIAWSPDGRKLASGCKNSQICVWDPETGQQKGKTLTGHKQWITWLAWKPFHLDADCRFLASSSKDGSVKIWDTLMSQCHITLSGHLQSVTCIKWGGANLIYSASQDRTVKVWRAEDGVLCRTLQGHGHWVNILALSTDYVMRTGAFEPANATIVPRDTEESAESLSKVAKERYEKAKGNGPERLVSGSDDFTLYLWQPNEDKKPITRMTGHQQLINDVRFSPDTRLIASASFDKSCKLWDGRNGKFLATFRGHVNRVYQVAWSADSRLVCSGSSDSTLKVWDIKQKKLLLDLPGHADEVYAVDWSPDGQRVASGGKDKVLKIWRK
ncbi:notchless protein homolog 1-like [Ostrea edulis]|uniref:notchless protein homolog 1-like n=1 Tax=Ostrea edulis TaxID=37623 RepID=UPI002094BED7|nr:notchless protein homolog 1-like [Ostrea edulis]